MQTIYYHSYEISGHHYLVGATESGLAFVGSQDKTIAELRQFYPQSDLIDDETIVRPYVAQLTEYLQGTRQSFDLKTDINGTPFQNAVWEQLQKIPYGQTSNYSLIAQQIKRPKAMRAVGTAIGKNPLLMVIPCHRVLAKDGHLGGYRGGLAMKRELLKLEQQEQ